MTKDEAIKALQKYFDIRELVDKSVFDRFGINAWQIFDTELLITILKLRTDILRVPLVCNNWTSGGSYSQRGFRPNISQIVSEKTKQGKLYVSAHTIGKGVDLSSPKMTADEMRETIVKNARLLPYRIRLENGKDAPTWLHIDTMTKIGGMDKITWF